MADFEIYTYTSNAGDTFRIRLDEDTATAGGFTAGAADATRPFVKVSKSNREFGIRPRGVRLSREDGNAIRYRFLPCATAAQQASVAAGGSVTIGGVSWTNVISVVPEDL